MSIFSFGSEPKPKNKEEFKYLSYMNPPKRVTLKKKATKKKVVKKKGKKK